MKTLFHYAEAGDFGNFRVTEPARMSGDFDGKGRTLIQAFPSYCPMITTTGPTRIRNLQIQCSQGFRGPSFRPTVILAQHQLELENVSVNGIHTFGVEFTHSKHHRFRDCHFRYAKTGQLWGDGRVAIFAGAFNVEDVVIDGCTFHCAGEADGGVVISKGGNIWVERCTFEDYRFEGVALNAGPAWVSRNSFRTSVQGESCIACLFWADTAETSREAAHYILKPKYRFSGNEVVGGRGGVNAGRPHNATTPMRMNVEIERNDFDVSEDAVIVSACDDAQIVGNRGKAGTFVRVAALGPNGVCRDVTVGDNRVTAESGNWLEVSQELCGALIITGNNGGVHAGRHLRLVHPRGGYRVRQWNNRWERNGLLVAVDLETVRYPESVGKLHFEDPGESRGPLLSDA